MAANQQKRSKSSSSKPTPKANPVELTAAAVNHLVRSLPSGTAYCIGIVLIVMMTGRLVQSQGSLARAVLPLVFHLKWGWHRVELTFHGIFKRDIWLANVTTLLAKVLQSPKQKCYRYLNNWYKQNKIYCF